MFDWFWEFLYLITKSIFKLIDGLIDVTKVLCGIEKIEVDENDVDLVQWLISTDSVKDGFKMTCIISIFLIVFFSIWGIVKNVISDKPQLTPGQVVMKALKCILEFLFIPVIMIVLMESLNTIAEALYYATLGGKMQSLGQFLAISFGSDAFKSTAEVPTISAVMSLDGFTYKNTDMMWNYFDLSDYDYFFSWVAGIAILFSMTKILLIFVDRLFSIVFLFIISPIPISASILDDGERFKNWRDQLLTKFCVGYSAIIGLNIFAVVISQLATADISFLNNWFLDFIIKLVIIIGGAVSIEKFVGLVGNILVKQGAGDAELKGAEGMKQGLEGVGNMAMGLLSKAAGGKGKKGGGKDGVPKNGTNNSDGASSNTGEGSSEGSDDGNKNPAMTPGQGTMGGGAEGAAANPYIAAGVAVTNAMEDKKEEGNKKNQDDKKQNNSITQAMNNNNNNNNNNQKGDNKKK